MSLALCIRKIDRTLSTSDQFMSRLRTLSLCSDDPEEGARAWCCQVSFSDCRATEAVLIGVKEGGQDRDTRKRGDMKKRRAARRMESQRSAVDR